MSASRIDVHAHFLPGFYREALIGAGITRPDGMPAIPEWSEAAAIACMDELEIATAMLSISSPGVYFGDAEKANELTRRVNEEGARLVDAYPGRFGWFASTSLPDVEAAVHQVSYALDTLHADGIVFETNASSIYLGDPCLNPLYEELNQRKAVLFLHPTSPACVGCDSLSLDYPHPMLEFMFDTTRTVANMILSGVTVRYPDIRIIVPHAGAALSVLTSRIDLLMPFFQQHSAAKSPSMRVELHKLYFDLAGAPLPELLPALRSIADDSHIVYGSDWPFTQKKSCLRLAEQLDQTETLTSTLKRMFMRENAGTLFPRLGAAAKAGIADSARI